MTGVDLGVEEPWELPEGWAWTRLATIAEFIGRGRGPSYVETGGVPVVNQKCVRWRSIDKRHLKHTAREAFDRLPPSLLLRAGDILWNSTGSGTIGRAAIYDGKSGEITCDSHVTIVRLRECDPAYVAYLIETIRVQHLVTEGNVGSTNQLELPRSFVEELSIPLPPFAEQRRIVARIDVLFAEIAEGEAALARARAGLETFRRALLKAAVTGELTREWRASSKPSDGARAVLARIDEAKAGTSKRRGRSVSLVEPESSGLPELPATWLWSTLGALGEIVGGVTVDKKRSPVDPVTVPYLRVANVQRGHLALDAIKQIVVERTVADRLRLQPGDILLNEGGDRDKIGRGWIWNAEIEGAIHQNHVFRVRPYDSGIKSEFVSHYANEMGRRFFIEEGKQTTNLASISMSKITCLPVPVPPPDEATEILRRVFDALAAQADTLALLDAEAADAARLRQSVLKAAFEGRLVPQDPTDEPARAMLERLAAQPTATASRRRGRPKRTER